MSYWGNNCDYNCSECPFSCECTLEILSKDQGQRSFEMQCEEKEQESGLSFNLTIA